MEFGAHSSLLRLVIFAFCCILLCSSSSTHHEVREGAVLVTGTVYCDTCFRQPDAKSTQVISGGWVAVECGSSGSNSPSYRTVVRTNRQGVFRAHLPAKIGGDRLHYLESCAVELIKTNQPFCAVASSATVPRQLRLKSRRHGVHVYSAGFFSFKPLNQPEMCSQKPVPFGDQKAPAEEQAGTGGFFPPLPPFNLLPPLLPSSPPASSALLPPFPLHPPSAPVNFPPPADTAIAPPRAGWGLLFPPATPLVLPFPRLPGLPPAFP
ncbi:formin-1-like [Zingiber officinale]|uniref:Pollen Ole e 1 allergen and extensin family protein n=1 Tax=Zingiber officinale TaxID=94328 RepID=A0A8J5F155_ZINOF|nr:formin-1-like [Zingiber officinale]KAG6476406.1 hypothetical protein ZIOFF_065646 [Zingiber officinale]